MEVLLRSDKLWIEVGIRQKKKGNYLYRRTFESSNEIKIHLPESLQSTRWVTGIWDDLRESGILIGVQHNQLVVITSPDCITWTQRVVPNDVIDTNEIKIHAFDSNLQIDCNTTQGKKYFTSYDGVVWSIRYEKENNAGFAWSSRDICWSQEMSHWIVVGNDGTLKVSNDGINWRPVSSPGIRIDDPKTYNPPKEVIGTSDEEDARKELEAYLKSYRTTKESDKILLSEEQLLEARKNNPGKLLNKHIEVRLSIPTVAIIISIVTLLSIILWR